MKLHWRGRPYPVPATHRAALARVLDVPVAVIDAVRVLELSRFARWHGGRTLATTRRGVIYVQGDGDAFLAQPELVLHEYFHVVGQWRTGRLTALRYVAECLRAGYARNRYEVEARAFARDQLSAFCRLLRP